MAFKSKLIAALLLSTVLSGCIGTKGAAHEARPAAERMATIAVAPATENTVDNAVVPAVLAAPASYTQAVPLGADLPASADAAPDRIRIPASAVTEMATAFEHSFPDGRNAPSLEVAGVLVLTPEKEVEVKYSEVGDTFFSYPNRDAAKTNGERVVGTFHTHPYADIPEEGGHTGVAHSGQDFIYALFYRDATFVEAGTKQFLLLPTEMSPEMPNSQWKSFSKGFMDMLNERTLGGMDFAEAHIEVGKIYAERYNIAFYEGENGLFSRL